MKNLIYIAAGGALGAVGRFATAGLAHRLLGTGFPYGTLAVNVVGCLAIGFLMDVALLTDLVPRTIRVAATIGFLGAFTTFSTFSYETLGYIEDGAFVPAALNIAANVVLCMAAVWAGTVMARSLFGAS